MLPYERFRCWREAHALTLAVYDVTKSWPPEERFGLSSQVRRAAFSVAANIAEGSAKRGAPEFRRYLDISLGSLSEVAYCLRLARDAGILPEPEWERLEQLRANTGVLTWRLYVSVRNRARR